MKVVSMPRGLSTPRLIWRKIGSSIYPSSMTEGDHYEGSGVVVSGGIMLKGRTELHVFDIGSVVGNNFCKRSSFSMLLGQTSFLRMTMHAQSGLLMFSLY
ncbi:hypothetical protein TNCV_4744661 [Trichonephila clavipes]|nr:hypothetical protein TNCV_4744661 [Trichonephila clavipes]